MSTFFCLLSKDGLKLSLPTFQSIHACVQVVKKLSNNPNKIEDWRKRICISIGAIFSKEYGLSVVSTGTVWARL